MVSLDDPFERDVWFLEFNKFGARFAEARMQLLNMEKMPQEVWFIIRNSISHHKTEVLFIYRAKMWQLRLHVLKRQVEK